MIKSFVHQDVTCDGCKASPLTGDRFSCETCDYDLCYLCEPQSDHPHALRLVPTALDFKETQSDKGTTPRPKSSLWTFNEAFPVISQVFGEKLVTQDQKQLHSCS